MKPKFLAIALFITLHSSSFLLADIIRPIDASLACVGSRDRGVYQVRITSAANGTQISINTMPLGSSDQLTVASEGNVYIQQVNRSYNLFLSDSGLRQLLNANVGRRFVVEQLRGTLTLLGTNPQAEYRLVCNGSFVAR